MWFSYCLQWWITITKISFVVTSYTAPSTWKNSLSHPPPPPTFFTECPPLLLKLKGNNCFYARIPELILKTNSLDCFLDCFMAYALNSEKWYSTWIPDDVFLFWIQSEVKFYFGPTNKLNENNSFISFNTKGLRVRSNNFPYQMPLFHNISHFVSALVCSFVLYMLKTNS